MKHDDPAELEADTEANPEANTAENTAETASANGAYSGTGGEPAASGFNPYASAPRDRDEHGGAPHGFFAWLRSLGIQRQPGWIGGVAAGISARIGVDPIVVRGVLVVLAIFAAPVVLFYGIAWLLLPDTEGRIHAQSLARGEPQPALAGIAIFVLLGLFAPLSSVLDSLPFGGLWFGGFGYGGWSFSSVVGTFFTLLILAALTVFIVWLARRNTHTSRGGGAESALRTDAAGTTVVSSTDGGGIRSGDPDAAAHHSAVATAAAVSGAVAGAAGAAAAAGAGSATTEYEPVAPGAGATTDELAAWKLQHEAWRIERERFNRAQADADRAARTQWAAENKARSQAFAAQATEHRRLRKLERPRLSASAVFFTLGVALVAGAGSAIAALGNDDTTDYAATVGVLVAALVASVAMIVAGIARRRSGFLALVAIVLLVIGVGSAVLPRSSDFLWPGQTIDNGFGSRTVTQPWGDLTAWVYDGAEIGAAPSILTVTKANGDIYIHLMHESSSLALNTSLTADQSITLSRTVDGVNVPPEVITPDRTGQSSINLEDGEPADLTLNAELGNGSIHIFQYID